MIITFLFSSIGTLLAQEPGLKNVMGGQINLVSLKGAHYDDGQIEPSCRKDAKAKHLDFRPYMAWKLSKHTLIGCGLGYAKNQNTFKTYGNNGTTLGTQKKLPSAIQREFLLGTTFALLLSLGYSLSLILAFPKKKMSNGLWAIFIKANPLTGISSEKYRRA
ncbi:MAG: hypothetical protein IPM82_30695 [Saprospiraceae bacterium]|nr:hypothetical protein [Saprospiraceae bacterium]